MVVAVVVVMIYTHTADPYIPDDIDHDKSQTDVAAGGVASAAVVVAGLKLRKFVTVAETQMERLRRQITTMVESEAPALCIYMGEDPNTAPGKSFTCRLSLYVCL